MHKLWSLVALAALAGCDPVKANEPLDGPPEDSPPDTTLPDAPLPDTPPPPPINYDIAYVNEMTFANSGGIGIGSFVVVVNRSTVPLDLAMTSVVMFSDDNAALAWTFTKSGNSTTQLQPGRAAGDLSPLATTRILDSGLVTEPVTAGANFNFGMQFANIPTTMFNLNGQATISIQGKQINLPFTIHFVPGASTAFNNASRIRTL